MIIPLCIKQGKLLFDREKRAATVNGANSNRTAFLMSPAYLHRSAPMHLHRDKAHHFRMTAYDNISAAVFGKIQKLRKKRSRKQHGASRSAFIRQSVNKALVFDKSKDQRFYTVCGQKRLIALKKDAGIGKNQMIQSDTYGVV